MPAPFNRNIDSLVADRNGIALKNFLATTQEEWAAKHMALRYNAAVPAAGEDPGTFPSRCYNHLKSEYAQLRAWFTEPEYKLSALLQSKFLSAQFNGPLGDGFGWDFRRDGDTEPRMLQFKSTLIACYRQMEMLPRSDRTISNVSVSGIARLVVGAYRSRAEIHMWRSVERRKDDKVILVCSGEELARRWVAFRTHAYLGSLGLDPAWSWAVSGCQKIFGVIDEVPELDNPGDEP